MTVITIGASALFGAVIVLLFLSGAYERKCAECRALEEELENLRYDREYEQSLRYEREIDLDDAREIITWQRDELHKAKHGRLVTYDYTDN